MILPSQVADAIDEMFGPSRNELQDQAVRETHRIEVQALLALIEEIPRGLIDLAYLDYLDFTRCRASLAAAVARWNAGEHQPAKVVGMRDPVERLRQLLKKCPDEPPAPETDLPFIADTDLRHGIQAWISAARVDYRAREWTGATVLAAAALEAILLWAVTKAGNMASPDRLELHKLIDGAKDNGLIGSVAAEHAHLARDARNLIHPGRASRTGSACSRSTALAAFAAVFAVIEDLS